MSTEIFKYLFWALSLILQQFSHGISSRAKNSNKAVYNAFASVLSNGVWFFNFYVLTTNAIEKKGDISYLLFMGLFYIVFCVIGSVLSQVVAVNYFEKEETLDWSLRFWK